MKKGLKWALLIVAVLIVIGIYAGQNGDKSSTASVGNKSVDTTTAKEKAEKPKEEEKPELSKTGVSSDVTIQVDGLETASTLGNNQFATAEAQGIFKVVQVTLLNGQKDAISVTNSSFTLVDDQGREFEASTEAVLALSSSTGKEKKKTFMFEKINPGIQVTGYIAYDVPKDAKGFTLQARGGMTGESITLKVE
ncbi:DUF4352 domain-containing protein [Paenibacillus sp. UMB4589-SE434]|uniref:DUF4352 domain-containing protein n=1 Tax=Paenibacillus sp. UMB4589-SE434 TaxID=3046314 RepID=UPI00254BC371|nr:DUF4352 domain-containing protein [Paenibacillus sp. UMB4589-SE434]MDK8181176.1 DUF4352 domain-containing protein [Paenibacillus sp. UMB4589-SE434]